MPELPAPEDAPYVDNGAGVCEQAANDSADVSKSIRNIKTIDISDD